MKVGTIVAVAVAVLSCAAQAKEAETLSSGGPVDVGFYVAPQVRIGSFSNGALAWTGAEATVLLGDVFGIGVSYQRAIGFGSYQPAMFYVGPVIRAALNANKVFHPVFAITGAFGRTVRFPGFSVDSGYNFAVIEPQALLEVNLAKHFRLTTGLTLQLTPGFGTSANPTFMLGLEIGSF